MNILKVLFVFYCSLSIVLTAPYGNRLTDNESEQLSQILDAGDTPKAIAALLGDNRRLTQSPYVMRHLHRMIELNRLQSLQYILTVIDFLPGTSFDSYIIVMPLLLVESFSRHRPEVCEFLCTLGFNIPTNYWYGDSCWLNQTIEWTVPELVDFVRRRPRLINFLTPQRYPLNECRNVEHGLMLLDFLCQANTIDKARAVARQPFEPTTMLREFVDKRINLGDEDSARIISRLVELGANLDEGLIARLAETDPSRTASIQTIKDYLSLDIKEPEEQ